MALHTDLPWPSTRYKAELEDIRVLHLNDSLFYRNPEDIRQSRATCGMFFWDNELVKGCGLKRENITTIQVLHKPWLFNKPGDEGMYHAQSPNVPGIDPADELEYAKAVEATRRAYELVEAGETERVAQATPSGTLSCADVLAKV